MLKKNKKGQVAVLDLFVSALVFGILVATIMVTWNSYGVKIDKQLDYNTNLLRAYHISDLLTRFPGKPSFWGLQHALGPQDVEIIGLAKSDRILDTVKVISFKNMDYNESKQKLGISSYEYYFRVSKLDGSDFSPAIESGIKDNESEITVTLKRYVIYNETESILEFWLQK
jgi:hypothetical protein